LRNIVVSQTLLIIYKHIEKKAAADVGVGVGNAAPVHEEQTVIQIPVIATARVQAWVGRVKVPVIARHRLCIDSPNSYIKFKIILLF